MPNSKQIVYLSQAQYAELITNGSITVDGVTVEYNENDLYVTPQAEPVTDVQINGTSVITNGIANVPMAKERAETGVVKVNSSFGITEILGNLILVETSIAEAKTGASQYRAILPKIQHASAFYGLAKAAGADMKDIANTTIGIYPDAQKAAIQNMLGVTDLISTEETTTATTAHAINSTFMMNGKLHRATAAIAIGDAVEVGTNCEVVKADEVFPHDVQVNGTSIVSNGVANIPKAGSGSGGTLGVVTSNSSYGTTINSGGAVIIAKATDADMKTGIGQYRPVTPYTQHMSVFYGLSKVAGIDLKDETVTLGTYPETSKTAIRSLIGAAAASDVTVSDVQVNGTSVLSNGVANIPVASTSDYGAVKLGGGGQTGLKLDSTSGILMLEEANTLAIKTATNNHNPITPYYQKESVFYGLASASGDTTQKSSSNAVGTYTESAKASIRTMLGAASTNIVAVQDEQPTDTDTKVWLPGTQAAGVQVPTMEDMQDYVKFTDYATTSIAGVVKVDNSYGISINPNGHIRIYAAGAAVIKDGMASYYPIVPIQQHTSTFYGLAKAAGDTTQSQSDNAVGTYTDEAKTAIRSMLGAVGDVQANGTSVVSNGVANLPYATTSRFGVTKIGSGLQQGSDGSVMIQSASTSQIKAGLSLYNAIMPGTQHQSVFYGLAKLAGVDMASSSNEIGTYTSEAKSAIQSMLGIDLQSIASEVEIPLVETVSGTTPTINGQPNTRYVCGEVSTLSITPPSAGSIDVIFDSGSTPAVITVPNTVRWPVWFDVTALEADTTYEILITDGVYGSVMTWEN